MCDDGLFVGLSWVLHAAHVLQLSFSKPHHLHTTLMRLVCKHRLVHSQTVQSHAALPPLVIRSGGPGLLLERANLAGAWGFDG